MDGFLDIAVRFRELIEILDNTRESESIKIANDLSALIRLRVQVDKVDENGQSYGRYSQAVVPQTYFWGKSLSQGAEDRIRDGDWFLSYEDFKVANNQPVDAKNYTFSGEMWRDTGVTIVDSGKNSTEITIGGQTTRAKELLAFNSSRDGVNLLAPSEQEIDFVVEAHTERIVNIINEVFS